MMIRFISAAIILLNRTSVVGGFGPKKAMLKLDAVPTVFCFLNPAKHRKFSKAREARALHHPIIED